MKCNRTSILKNNNNNNNQLCFSGEWDFISGIGLQEPKTESIRKLSNFNFQWTKTLCQNNLTNIAFFFTFFKG